MIDAPLNSGIIIRQLDIRQTQEFYDFIIRNKAFFIDTIPFVSEISAIADVEIIIKNGLDRYSKGLGLYYTLWDRTRIVGYVLARDINEKSKWAEIGYMIDHAYAGKGIIKASCIKLINYLFDFIGMEKILICCSDDNKSSMAVAAKLGFVLEGTLRHHTLINGKIRNTLYLGMLKEEYRPY